MRLGKYLMAAAAATLAVAPAVAAPVNPASSLSVIPSVRAASSAHRSSELAGGGTIVALIAVIIVIGGIIAVASSDDKPNSP